MEYKHTAETIAIETKDHITSVRRCITFLLESLNGFYIKEKKTRLFNEQGYNLIKENLKNKAYLAYKPILKPTKKQTQFEDYSKLINIYKEFNLSARLIANVRYYINDKVEIYKLKGGLFIHNSNISFVKLIIDNYLQDEVDEDSLPNSYVKYSVTKTDKTDIFKVIYKESYDSKNEELYLTKEQLIKLTTK